jgi:hypothetical protein
LNVKEILSIVISTLSLTEAEKLLPFNAIENFQYWKKIEINNITNHRIIIIGNTKKLSFNTPNTDNLDTAII